MTMRGRLDQISYKGTHNSYQCTEGTDAIMNHPIDVQIDAFGCWTVELDVGVEIDPSTGQLAL